MRELAEAHDFRIGSAANKVPLVHDARYRELLAREFSVLTPGNAMKFGPLRPTEARFDEKPARDNLPEALKQWISWDKPGITG